MLLSVIVPMLNEEEVVRETHKILSAVLKDVEHELIYIDDGSTDTTRSILEDDLLAGQEVHKCISFSRNFGHQAAFSAGLQEATGDAVVIIDGDLQDPPELIIEMLKKWKEGYQVVYAQRKSRKGESIFKLITAKIYYRLLGMFMSVEIPVDTGDYRLMDRAVVNQLNNLPERSRFLRGLVPWVGFKQTGILYDRKERFAGETKYSLSKMMRLAADGITSFSHVPLKFALIAGLGSTGVGIVLGVYAGVMKILYPEATEAGWASLVMAITFLGGTQLLTIGILGVYIGRIYDEVKQRPLYIINKDK